MVVLKRFVLVVKWRHYSQYLVLYCERVCVLRVLPVRYLPYFNDARNWLQPRDFRVYSSSRAENARREIFGYLYSYVVLIDHHNILLLQLYVTR